MRGLFGEKYLNRLVFVFLFLARRYDQRKTCAKKEQSKHRRPCECPRKAAAWDDQVIKKWQDHQKQQDRSHRNHNYSSESHIYFFESPSNLMFY